MQLVYSGRYWTKNFYKDIGLSSHFTFQGFLRRIKRRYPKTYIFTIRTINFSLFVSILLLGTPGSLLPLQRQLKLFLLKKYTDYSYFWNINQYNPNPLKYLANFGWITKYGLEHRLYQKQQIANLMKKQIDVLKYENLIITNRIRLEVLMNFSGILARLLDDKFSIQLLKSKQVRQNFRDAIDEAALRIKQSEGLRDELKTAYIRIFKIYEYLLKFSQLNSERLEILQRLATNLELQSPQWSFLGRQFAKQQTLKIQLKRILSQNPKQEKIRTQIYKILAQVNNAILLKT